MIFEVPVLRGCSTVSLAAVLEPVADLCGCESRGLGQVAFPGRVGVGVLEVPLSQQTTSSFLETHVETYGIVRMLCFIQLTCYVIFSF